MDKLHGIEAFTVLLPVVNDSGNIRMLDLRGRACLTQEARTGRGIGRQFPRNDLQRDGRIEDRVASTVSNAHRSRAKYLRVAIGVDFHFEVSVTQRTKSDVSALAASVDFVVLGEKAKANQAPNTFAVRAGMGNLLTASRANSRADSLLRSHGAHAVRMRYT